LRVRPVDGDEVVVLDVGHQRHRQHPQPRVSCRHDMWRQAETAARADQVLKAAALAGEMHLRQYCLAVEGALEAAQDDRHRFRAAEWIEPLRLADACPLSHGMVACTGTGVVEPAGALPAIKSRRRVTIFQDGAESILGRPVCAFIEERDCCVVASLASERGSFRYQPPRLLELRDSALRLLVLRQFDLSNLYVQLCGDRGLY
jgi:hypothetical protein